MAEYVTPEEWFEARRRLISTHSGDCWKWHVDCAYWLGQQNGAQRTLGFTRQALRLEKVDRPNRIINRVLFGNPDGADATLRLDQLGSIDQAGVDAWLFGSDARPDLPGSGANGVSDCEDGLSNDKP